MNVTEKLKFVSEKVENIVGKGKRKCWFPFSQNVFKGFYFKIVKSPY